MLNVKSMRHAQPSTGTAFIIHLALSLLIFSSLVVMMVLYWFPGELFFIDGGWQGLKLVAMVDLVLGPALTLMLYKPGKPKLAFDMSMIAAIQILALGYGFYTTYHQRTVAVVYSEQGFATVSAKDHEESSKQLLSFNIEPKAIGDARFLEVPLYLTPDPLPGEYGKFLENLLNGYPGPRERSDQYVALDSKPEEMKKGELTDADLEQRGVLEAVESALAKERIRREDIELYKFDARYAKGVVLYDPKSQRIIDYVPKKNNQQTVAEADTE